MTTRKLFAVLLPLAVVLGACSGSGATAEPLATNSAAPSQPAATTEQPSADASEQPSPSTAQGPQQFQIGEWIKVSGDFISSDVNVRAAEVKQAKKYGDYSKPAAGNIYLAVKYEYEALEDGATYNPFDWQVFVDGTAIPNYAFVVDGPKPELASGTLPKGRKASGWVVYEVPTKGQVLLSYGANMFGGNAPTFEVVARKS